MPNPSDFNFGTAVGLLGLSPMANDKLVISSFFPSGRFGILQLKCGKVVTQLLQYLTGTVLPWSTVALNEHTLIVSGNDALTFAPVVQKYTLDNNFQVISVEDITPAGLVLPLSLAKSPDGTKVYVSNYNFLTLHKALL